MNIVYNEDCVEGMKRFADNYFDLAIVDPPYGIGENGSRGNPSSDKWKNPKPNQYTKKDWDNKRPTKEYWDELFRVSKNQVVFGGNYFTEFLPPSMGWIYWDKCTGDSDYSDGELAFTSFERALKRFDWMWNGFRQKRIEKRIHPTQKPVALYGWILQNYAICNQCFNTGMVKDNDATGEMIPCETCGGKFKILDTHVGSGSSRIASNMGDFDFIGFEVDEDYWKAQEKRYVNYKSQLVLF